MYCAGDEALGRKSRDKMRQNSDGRHAVSEALSFANFTFHSRRHFRGLPPTTASKLMLSTYLRPTA